jgi:hypothetical protein
VQLTSNSPSAITKNRSAASPSRTIASPGPHSISVTRQHTFSTVQSGSGAKSGRLRSSSKGRTGTPLPASNRASAAQRSAANTGRQAPTASSAPRMPSRLTSTGARIAPTPVVSQ